jgi:hypothetical protein
MSDNTVRLQPFVSSGEPFVTEEGKIQPVPISLWRTSTGGVAFRVGRNVFFFTSDGRYDGPEAKCNESVDVNALVAAMERGRKNRGRAPTESYHDEGTPGFMAETAIWPRLGEIPPNDEPPGGSTIYKTGRP